MDQLVAMDERKDARKEDEKAVIVANGTATLPSTSDEEKGPETRLQSINLSEQPDLELASFLQCLLLMTKTS
jgi:hypothetical protein